MSSGCGDVLSLADLQTAKKHQIFEAEVITGKSGGVAGGADIDYATNQVTGQTQKTLPAVLRDAGFSPVSWDFSTGGTLAVDDRDKVVYDPVSKTWYSYAGTLPATVPAGFNPVGNADWKPQTDPDLRNELASTSGAGIIGVQPSGTLQQTLTHVTPEQFGADGTGVSSSTSSFNSAFAHASSTGVTVVATGEYLLDGPITTNGVPFDFSKATFYVDGATLGDNVKLILINEPDTQEVTNFALSMTKGQSGTPSLSSYDECTVAIDTTEDAYLRAISPAYTLKKQDILVINKNVHRLTPAFFDINSNVTLTVKPLRPQVHCRLPKFVINSVPSTRLGALVYITRNNVHVSGGFVDSEALSTTNGRNILESFIRIEKCAFPYVSDVNTKMSPLDSSYQVVADQVHGLVMKRCNDQTGWRLQDGNFFRNTVVRDCQGRGIGGHAMTYNYTVENFTNCFNGIHVNGGGLLKVTNMKCVDWGGNLASEGIIKIREDYGSSWDGDIEVDSVDIIVQSVTGSATAISGIVMWAAYTGSYDYTQPSVAWGRSISIKNVHIRNNSANRVTFTPVEFKTSLAQNVTPPQRVTVDTITQSGAGEIRILPLGFDLFSDTKVAEVTTTFVVSNIENKLGTVDLAVTIADGTKPTVRNKVVRRIRNYTGLGLTLSVPAGNYTYVENSVVNFINGSATDAGSHYFYNCRMTGTEFSTNLGYNHFYNCHFDTATAGFKVGTRVTVGCHINAGATITSGGGGVSTAANLWSYKSATYS